MERRFDPRLLAALAGGMTLLAATPGRAETTLPLNPQLSVILDGVYYDDSLDGSGDAMLGQTAGIFHAHGHDHDHDHGGHQHGLEQGFNLRHTEVAITGGIDGMFDARINVAISDEGDVELEEAFVATTGLPAGLRLKAGKFLSGIGYANEKHPHDWDFVDQNLAYRTLLGDHGLSDTGLQLTWLPAWDHYTRFGIEAFQGDNTERLGTESDHAEHLPEREKAPRLWTAFAKWSPDLGHDHALQLGASAAFFRNHQEMHHAGEASEHGVDGDARLYGLDAVYKYDSGQAYGQGDWRVSAEYLRAEKRLELAHHANRPDVIGEARDFSEDGLYLQATYGIAPRWEVGLRYDAVGLTNEKRGPRPAIAKDYDDSQRWTTAATWHISETSRLRAQVAQVDGAFDDHREDYTQFYLQYQMSLGAHGAHNF
jgi:hypothetical protein